MNKFELINNVWDSKKCRECCSDCSESCNSDCPLEFEGTCENCIFKDGYRKELK